MNSFMVSMFIVVDNNITAVKQSEIKDLLLRSNPHPGCSPWVVQSLSISAAGSNSLSSPVYPVPFSLLDHEP